MVSVNTLQRRTAARAFFQNRSETFSNLDLFRLFIRDRHRFVVRSRVVHREATDERLIFAFFVELWKVMHDRYTLVNDQAQSKDSPFGDLDSSFLIANRNGIFKVSPDMDVSRFDQYFAIGSGAEYALGAMHSVYDALDDADEIARRGVETAGAFDVYCGGETTVLSVDSSD